MTKADFENYCRRVLIGRKITKVLYGEVNYAFCEELPDEPIRYYHTDFEELHSLDFSIAFMNEDKLIYITWDGTFYQYGLYPFVLAKTEYEAKREQCWDVTEEPMWQPCIGHSIANLEIVWEDIYDVGHTGHKLHIAICPYAFCLKLSNETQVFVSAAELRSDGIEAYGLADNLLVTTNERLAKQINMI
ncbi:hypothetical protein LJ737_19260 [Hymenobacter sp. 15J16-1T3B]|uniref:hypothetical protein n=1 Tax=Hymenobacter sp. 15J16-1T3B TaxID=2886941 RepID=UPI001D120BF5|nr:hypothetical protein [Hymenobacter sp. 15J16-1T3B]MCC3159389.1 hypothetical protein [Hymenobacter sp. 15J16-1T3B]